MVDDTAPEVPICFVECVNTWFTKMSARTKVNEMIVQCCTYKKGLPKGQVMSHLHYHHLYYYHQQALSSIESTTLVTTYANYLALLCRSCNKDEVVARLVPEVNKFARWKSENCPTLCTSKSEVTLLTMDDAQTLC